MLKFSSFRLSLIKVDNLFNAQVSKEQYFKDFLDTIIERRKHEFVSGSKRYIFYYIDELLPGVYCFQLAKEEVKITLKEGDTKVEEEPTIQTPFVYVILDRDKQLVLINEKTSVFQDINTSRGKIEHLFTENLQIHDITTYLLPIGDSNDFWKEVEESDSISQLDISLIAPNMFGGRMKAADFVKETKEKLNITQVDLKFKNKKGKLSVLKENVGDFIDLVVSGAGKFKLFRKKNGKREPIASDQLVQKKEYSQSKPEEIDKTLLAEDLSTLDTLNEHELPAKGKGVKRQKKSPSEKNKQRRK